MYVYTYLFIYASMPCISGLPRCFGGKESTCQQETWVQSLGQEDPLEEEMATPSNIFPEKSHGERSLAGYSP